MKSDIIYRDYCFEIAVSGVLIPNRFEGILKKLLAHEKWESDSTIMFDYTDVDVTCLTPYQMKEIIHCCERWRTKIGRGKCAFIVPGKEQYVFARMFIRRAMFKWDVEMEAFETRSTAVNWLFDEQPSQYMLYVEPQVS